MRNFSKKSAVITWLLAGLFCVLTSLDAFAQNTVQISGKVADSYGEPVIGVAVFVEGTTNGTSTDVSGNYTLSVPEGATLIFSSIGFKTSKVKTSPGGAANIDVVLEEDFATLEATVVVGYGTQKAASLTGAVASVNMEELAGKPTVNVVESLQGTTPGLIIEQSNSAPGSRPSINIRGLNTMNDNNPLILIDGIVGDIQNVATGDIESISVLKDAASASIYGSRASNGVILITTKKGKAGRSEINYDFQYSFQQPTCLPQVVDSWVYAELRNEALINSGQTPTFTPEQIASYRNGGTNCKWINEIYRNYAPMMNHTLSATGGNDKTTYLISLGYLDQDSMFNGDKLGMKRYSARLNVSQKIFDNFTVTATASYNNHDIRDHAYWTEWIIEQSTRMPSIYEIKNPDGTYTYPSGSNSNALERLEKGGYRRSLNNDLNGTISADWEIIKGLHLRAMAGGRLTINSTHENRIASPAPQSGDKENHIGENMHRTTDLTGNATISYERSFGKHNASALFGYSYEGERYNWFSTQRLKEDSTYDIIGSNSQGDDVSNAGGGNAWALHSIFARINYNYDEKYLLEFNLRDDMSSKFRKGNRSAVFPSISLGWRISQEPFWQNISEWVPSLKIRGSWGLVGNDRIGLYAYMANVGTNQGYTFGDQYVNTAWFGSSNPDLKWETTRMVDVGFDISLLRKGNLNISFDFFDNMTRDILVTLPVAGIFGGGEPIQNAGKVKTWGWELSASYVLQTGQVRHTFSGNISDAMNKVVDTRGTESIGGYDVQTIIKEGYPLWSYYAYRCDGIFQSQEEIDNGPHLDGITPKVGDLRYIDKNGDGLIKEDDDRFIVGNRSPRYTFGLSYALEWKGLDFSMFWQGVGRRAVWLRGESVEAFHNNNEGPVFAYHLDRWTPANPNASYPRLTVGAESNNNAAKSDFWIENASYIRLKNVQLGYTLPSNITRKACIGKLRLFATVENALTFSKMKGGWDPEVSDGSGRIYPVTRTYSLGLSVTFNPKK